MLNSAAATNNALVHPSVWGGLPVVGSTNLPAGRLEYAVFRTSHFDDFLSDLGINPALDPTVDGPGKGLTYAYQLVDPVNNASVSVITVGETVNHDPAHNGVNNTSGDYTPTWWDPPGGLDQIPFSANDAGTSWAWNFLGANKITTGETSAILFFQTTLLPELDQASAAQPSGIQPNLVASIGRVYVPEPTAMCLAAIAVSGLLLGRRSRGR
jgi:hypothetical protein